MYTTGDLLALRMRAAEMREILHDIDVLTSYHEYTSLDKWIDDARAYSCDPVIQDYYEKNARNLITTWGGTLNDYASRTWSGLVAGYYAVRWDMYIDAVLQAVENNQEFNQKELDNRLKKFEEDWVASRTMTKRLTKGDLQECARHLLRKYEMRIN